MLLFVSIMNNSCESLDLDGQENPNNLALDKADPTLLLTQTQVDFRDFFFEMSDDTRPVVRMVGQFGTYTRAADPQEVQTQWTIAYADVLQNAKTIELISNSKSIPHHLAIAKILKAYTMVTLVDFYGDVPYTEALQGALNLKPKVDSGDSIYDAMFTELDQAIVLLGQNAGSVPLVDLFYGTYTLPTSPTKWIRVANTLKLKMYNNLRLTRDVSAQVNALVSAGNLMQSNDDDFNFKYTTANAPTESRHPDFTGNYFAEKAFHLSNSYYNLLRADFGPSAPDPRIRMYFYRQSRSNPAGANLPCSTNPTIPICYVGGGYWGRDHADGTGIPNDNTSRTIIGLYPAGGKYDNGGVTGHTANNGDINAATDKGANGAGLLNILDYSFSRFLLAELVLTEPGVSGTAGTILTSAVTSNLAKVRAFAPANQGSLAATTVTQDATYVTKVNTDYTALTTDSDRLNFIVKESFKAYWGNGMEGYNAYRRTGMPRWDATKKLGMQPPVISAGDFPRSFFYPKNALDNNTNITQKLLTVKVFWDNNPDGFIN